MTIKSELEIRVPIEELNNTEHHLLLIAQKLGVAAQDVSKLCLTRRSLDARAKNICYVLKYQVNIGAPGFEPEPFKLNLKQVHDSAPAIIVGFGPAGMFAALKLIELGIKPIILERGKPVRERRRDIAAITKQGIVNPNSNYCFGEGGAGTFSDGKLYTRAHKRGSIDRILNILIAHGASADILVDAHPHIGTNKLPALVEAIRNTIISHGGEIHFTSVVTELIYSSGKIRGVKTSAGIKHQADSIILATGHSARDIFQLFQEYNLKIEIKPFALGVRVEHPQSIVDKIQYHCSERNPLLPAAAYSMNTQVDRRGVFSFCMCPGGIICPAATSPDEVVVNGWSPSKRNSYYANSGIVVEVSAEDLAQFSSEGPLAGIQFQRSLEQQAFLLGGGSQKAPAQRLADFVAGKTSSSLPPCSYLPGLNSQDLALLFPPSILGRLRQAFKIFGQRYPGYLTNEAVVVAVESRTSSPVKIPRDSKTLMHPDIQGLFPCGEGAGYAGGIMSAAMDGERVAQAVGSFVDNGAKPTVP